MKKKILITGWAGYIWSHAVVAFEKAGYQSIIVDNFSNSSETALDWISKILWYIPLFYRTDLRQKSELNAIFEKHNIDWVIHFAGLKAVGESCKKPLLYFDNNISWSIKLFECMEKHAVQNIIFSSSATVYGSVIYENPDFSWALENDRTWNTTNPYWTTKFLLEQILKDLSKFAWFNVVHLRYFNPIWAHPSGFIGENPDWIPNNLLPYIMKVANGELEKLKVFWDDYKTIDGTWVRDYIDVNDLVDAHLLAYQKLENLEFKNSDSTQWQFETFNLWAGKWVSVLEMIKKSEEITWKKINYEVVWRRDWDLASVFCNPQKAEKGLWWKVESTLEDSLRNSWRFYSK